MANKSLLIIVFMVALSIVTISNANALIRPGEPVPHNPEWDTTGHWSNFKGLMAEIYAFIPAGKANIVLDQTFRDLQALVGLQPANGAKYLHLSDKTFGDWEILVGDRDGRAQDAMIMWIIDRNSRHFFVFRVDQKGNPIKAFETRNGQLESSIIDVIYQQWEAFTYKIEIDMLNERIRLKREAEESSRTK